MKISVSITINGRRYDRDVEPRLLLVHFIRDVLGLTGTKVGCDTSQCGSCTVLLDGVSAKACTCLAVQVDGASVTTIEGLGGDSDLHRLQRPHHAAGKPGQRGAEGEDGSVELADIDA